jgi:hypothetical protein
MTSGAPFVSIKLEIEIVKEDGRNLLKFDPDPKTS